MAESSLPFDRSAERPKYRYLQPSVFWSIRQGFPHWLSVLIVTISLAVPLVAWAIVSYANLLPPMFLPTPTAVIQSGIEMFTQDDLIVDVVASCARVGSGFLLSAAIGVPMGISTLR